MVAGFAGDGRGRLPSSRTKLPRTLLFLSLLNVWWLVSRWSGATVAVREGTEAETAAVGGDLVEEPLAKYCLSL